MVPNFFRFGCQLDRATTAPNGMLHHTINKPGEIDLVCTKIIVFPFFTTLQYIVLYFISSTAIKLETIDITLCIFQFVIFWMLFIVV